MRNGSVALICLLALILGAARGHTAGFLGGAGYFPKPSSANLLDSEIADPSGHWNLGWTSGHLNQLGKASISIVPPTADPEGRHTFGWTISKINGGSLHGTAPVDAFGTQSIPARPDSCTSCYALGVWAQSSGTSPHLRLEHGLEIDTMKYWYDRGYTQWKLSFYHLAMLHDTGNFMDQYMNIAAGGAFDIDPASLINQANASKDKLFIQIVDSTGKILISETAIHSFVPSTTPSWELVEWTMTITPAMAKKLKRYGRDAWQLQLEFGSGGRPRLIMYNPQMKLVQ